LNNKSENDEFIAFLKNNVRMQIYEDVMQDIFDSGSTTLPYRNIQKWFKTTNKQTMKAGNVVLFEKSDFDEDKELTGISWYIKTGRLQTDFNGVTHPLLSIDESIALDTTPSDAGPITPAEP